MKRMQRVLLGGMTVLLACLPLSVTAQWNKKPYTEWSEPDALKLLNDSPWGRTQVFSSPVTLFKQPTSGRQGSANPTVSDTANATHTNFRIRFLSAKPIRQAIVRLLEVKQKQPVSDDLLTHFNSLASGDFQEIIVITVSCDSQEAGANVQEAQALLHKLGTADLKNSTFLEIKGGKRTFLQEFQPPKRDGLGARFIFARQVDGQPFITPESQEVRFFTELSNTYKLDRRYKIKDMMYDGKLEY